MVKSSLDRAIAIFVSLMMIFTLLPTVNVYADDEPEKPAIPVITSVTPDEGVYAESETQTVTVVGENLDAITKIAIGATEFKGTVDDKGNLTFKLDPVKKAGSYTVVFSYLSGTATKTISKTLKIIAKPNDPTPVISSIEPAFGIVGQKATVTLSGTNLGSIASVKVGLVELTDFERDENATDTLDIEIPAQTKAGSYTITFGYYKNKTVSKTFKVYANETVAPATEPVITKVSPASCVAGPQTITITGKCLGNVTVSVDGQEISKDDITTQTASTIVFKATLSADKAEITVTDGNSKTATAEIEVTALPDAGDLTYEPAFGAANAATVVTVTGADGAGLNNVTKVTVKDANDAETNCSVKSKADAELVFTFPAKPAAEYNIILYFGETDVELGNFAVKGIPVISSIEPAVLAGDYNEEQEVTIHGSWLEGITKVMFGLTECELEEVTGDDVDQRTFTLPANMKAATYTVNFYYSDTKYVSKTIKLTAASIIMPTVSSVTPSTFPAESKQTITIKGTNLDKVAKVTIADSDYTDFTATATSIVINDVTVAAEGEEYTVVLTDEDGKTYTWSGFIVVTEAEEEPEPPEAPAEKDLVLTPASAMAGTSQTVTVTLAEDADGDLNAITAVTVDGKTCRITKQNETTLTFTFPALAKGKYDITFTTAGGDLTSADYPVYGKPIIATMKPAKGPANMEETVTLTGADLDAIYKIVIGIDTECTIVGPADAEAAADDEEEDEEDEDDTAKEGTTLVFTVPAIEKTGTYTIKFYYGNEQYLSKTYTIADLATLIPSITSVSPKSFIAGSTDTITITGKNLDLVTAVKLVKGDDAVTLADPEIKSTTITVALGGDEEAGEYDIVLVYDRGADKDQEAEGPSIVIKAVPTELELTPMTGVVGLTQTITAENADGSEGNLTLIQSVYLAKDGDKILDGSIIKKTEDSVEFTVKPVKADTYDVVFVLENGTPITVNGFEVKGVPVINSVSPLKAPAGTALPVTVKGENLGSIIEIEAGDTTIESKDISVTPGADGEDDTLTFTIPVEETEIGTVTVKFIYGTDLYHTATITFVDPDSLKPVITSVTPTILRAGVATDVTITGENLDVLTTVKFGSETVTIDDSADVTANKLVINVTINTAGDYDVSGTYGTSDTVDAGISVKVAVTPTADDVELDPAFGTVGISQVETVTIKEGSTGDLTLVSQIKLVGPAPSTKEAVIKATTQEEGKITFTMPSKAVGDYTLVLVIDGDDDASIEFDFPVKSAPTVTAITPSQAATGYEGQKVTVSGTNLEAITKVVMGTEVCYFEDQIEDEDDEEAEEELNSLASDAETLDERVLIVPLKEKAGSYTVLFYYSDSKYISKTFKYVSADTLKPSITKVTPASFIEDTPTALTVTGKYLTTVTGVTISAEEDVAGSTECDLTANAAGTLMTGSVTVDSKGDYFVVFAYVDPLGEEAYVSVPVKVTGTPEITSFEPSSAVEKTSQSITAKGTDLNSVTAIKVKNNETETTYNCTITSWAADGNSLVFTLPSVVKGTYTVIYEYGADSSEVNDFEVVAVPVITDYAPKTVVAGSTNQTITLEGENLNAISSIILNDNKDEPLALTGGSVTVAADGKSIQITIDEVTEDVYKYTFNYGNGKSIIKTVTISGKPEVTEMKPNEFIAGLEYTAKFIGENLTAVSSVTLNGDNLKFTVNAAGTEITVTFTAPANANNPFVFNYGSLTATNTSTYTISAAPEIKSINPTEGIEGLSYRVTATVTGGKLIDRIFVGDKECGIDSATDDTVIFTIPNTLTASNEAYKVAFTYGGSAELTESEATFTVKAAPTFEDMTPDKGVVGLEYTLTINGSGLESVDKITINNVDAGTVTKDDGSASVKFTPDAADKTYTVVVTYGADAVKPGTKNYTFTSRKFPVVTSIEPEEGVQGSEVFVTAKGSGLKDISKITVGSVTVTSFESQSDSELVFKFSAPANTSTVTFYCGATENNTGTTDEKALEGTFEFTAKSAPSFDAAKFDPDKGVVGFSHKVTITGSSLKLINKITGGTDETVIKPDEQTDTSITLTIPAQDTAGDYTVNFYYGTGTKIGNGVKFTFLAKPEVTGINPATGIAGLDYNITVTGSNMTGLDKVKVDGTEVENVTFSDSSFTVPQTAVTAGTHKVVFYYGGDERANYSFDFTVKKAPAMTTISPAQGTASKTYTVTINGTDLSSVTKVEIGKASASTFTEKTDTQLKFDITLDANDTGVQDVVLTYGDTNAASSKNEETVTVSGKFTVKGVPAAANSDVLTPAETFVGMACDVTLNGSNLDGVTSIVIGSTTITKFTVGTGGTTLKFTVPAQTETSDGLVMTFNYDGGDFTVNTFKVLEAPAIEKVEPEKGIVGLNHTITITGTNLDKVEKVVFGNVKTLTKGSDGTGNTFKYENNKITFQATASTATTVNITLKYANDKGTTPATPFVVSAKPSVTKITPTSGIGGESVDMTVTGTNLEGLYSISIGGTETKVADGELNKDTGATELVVTVNVPNGTSPLDVTFKYGDDNVNAALGTTFKFNLVPAPTEITLDSTSGLEGVDQTVTATGDHLSVVSSITIGSKDGTKCKITKQTDTSIEFTIPGQEAGKITLWFNWGASSKIEKEFEFKEMPENAPDFTIVSANPVTTKDSEIELNGKNLLAITDIYIGTEHFEITKQTDDVLTFKFPARTKATNYTITFKYSTKSASNKTMTKVVKVEAYKPPTPSITTIPSTAVVGTEITITGTNLDVIEQIWFGSYQCTSVVKSDDGNTLTITVPTTIAKAASYTVSFRYNYSGTSYSKIEKTVKVTLS